MTRPLRIVILGLSITSSWGNGHATTFRGLVRELSARGHDVLFLERDAPWYAANRDLPVPPYGRTALYGSRDELEEKWTDAVREADAVIVGSYVPEGVAVGRWVQQAARGLRAFYDIDTPVTLSALRHGTCAYLAPEMIPDYDLYLSFAGGPALTQLQAAFGSPRTVPLYCSVDPALYFPQDDYPGVEAAEDAYDLGYMGTYSDDRQPPLDRLLLEPARRWPEGRFVVAGPQYPDRVRWPGNVARIEHLPPATHREFYGRQRWTLNVTRADMVGLGWSPSVRLFEAAACGVPVVSDWWEGLDTFFVPGEEIVIARSAEDTLRALHDVSESERRAIGARARARVLAAHTAVHRAQELETYLTDTERHA